MTQESGLPARLRRLFPAAAFVLLPVGHGEAGSDAVLPALARAGHCFRIVAVEHVEAAVEAAHEFDVGAIDDDETETEVTGSGSQEESDASITHLQRIAAVRSQLITKDTMIWIC